MTSRLNQNIEKLKRAVKGNIVRPQDARYDKASRACNAMIDRLPAVILQCANADDVPHAIGFARENRLEIAIRGGGHNIAGYAVCDNGITIDLSNMKNVRVEASTKRAYVEPGATLAQPESVSAPRDCTFFSP